MRSFALTLALAAGLYVGLALAGAKDAENKVDAERIAKLVQQLGSDDFGEREAAVKTLNEIGEPALEALKKAVESPDAEVQRRAKDLVSKIEKRAETGKVLTPTRLRLEVKDKPVVEAVAELAKLSGYSITIAGDQTKLKDRRVTLDTGDTTFWQALDQLCQKADLAEWDGRSPIPAAQPQPPAPPAVPQPQPQPPGKPIAPPPPPPQQQKQIQIQPGQQGQIQIQVQMQAKRVAMPRPAEVPAPQGDVILLDGKSPVMPTCYVGALRLRALPVDSPLVASIGRNEGTTVVVVEARVEPKVLWQQAQGLRITKAVDEVGQSLEHIAEEMQPAMMPGHFVHGRRMRPGIPSAQGRQYIPIRFQLGEKPSKTLKELAGTLSAQVQSPLQALITVDNVLKAAGQTTKSANGEILTVQEIGKHDNNNYKVRVKVETPGDANALAMGGIVGMEAMQGLQTSAVRLSLLDAKGQPMQLVNLSSQIAQDNNGGRHFEQILIYQPAAEQGEPTKLVYSGRRTVTIDAPFTLENVPLP